MSDGKTYFYETEAEWTGAKDLKLSGAKQPAIAAGAPAGVPAVGTKTGR